MYLIYNYYKAHFKPWISSFSFVFHESRIFKVSPHMIEDRNWPDTRNPMYITTFKILQILKELFMLLWNVTYHVHVWCLLNHLSYTEIISSIVSLHHWKRFFFVFIFPKGRKYYITNTKWRFYVVLFLYRVSGTYVGNMW